MSSKTTLAPVFCSNSGPYFLRTKSSVELSRCWYLIDLPVAATAGAAAAGVAAPAAGAVGAAAAGLVGSAAAGFASGGLASAGLAAPDPPAGAAVGAAPEQAASRTAALAPASARKPRRLVRFRASIVLPSPRRRALVARSRQRPKDPRHR